MKVHIMKPYALDKNLGRAYNEACALIPDGDWICLMDYDTMFLTPDCGRLIHEYAERWMKNVGGPVLLTAWTNRISPLSDSQLIPVALNLYDNSNILDHIPTAERLAKNTPMLFTQITKVISGFLMMFPKSLWNEIKFSEDMKCLGVDNDFSRRVLEKYEIHRMDNVYVFHMYRMKNGIKDKSHLL